MRISELIKELEEIKEDLGDLEIYADTTPYDDAVEEIELAEVGIITRVQEDGYDDNRLVMDIYPQGEQRDLL